MAHHGVGVGGSVSAARTLKHYEQLGPNYSFKRTAAMFCGTIGPRSAAAA